MQSDVSAICCQKLLGIIHQIEIDVTGNLYYVFYTCELVSVILYIIISLGFVIFVTNNITDF